jgi:ribonuclease Z
MMRLIVLGSSASLPTKEHWPSCVALRYRDCVLFDCCEGAQKHMMKYKISYAKVKAILLSHLHADHFLGAPGLIQSFNMFQRKEPLYILGPKGTEEMFSKMLSIRQLRPDFEVIVKDVTGKEKKPVFEHELFSVRAFLVKHNTPALGYVLEEPAKRRFDEAKAKALGVRGKLFTIIQRHGKAVIAGRTVKYEDVSYVSPGRKIVYSGDTIECSSIVKASENADLLIHDSCYLDKDKEMAKEKWHSTALQAAKTAKKAKAKKLLLTHMSNRYDDRTPLLEEAKAVFENSLLAEEGAEILV